MWVKFMLLQNLLLLILYKKKLFFLFEETKPKMKTKPIFLQSKCLSSYIRGCQATKVRAIFSDANLLFVCWGVRR